MRIPKAELRPAWAWVCDECGGENFCRAVVAELSDEDREEVEEEHGVESGRTGDWVTTPDDVWCRHCGEFHLVEQPED